MERRNVRLDIFYHFIIFYHLYSLSFYNHYSTLFVVVVAKLSKSGTRSRTGPCLTERKNVRLDSFIMCLFYNYCVTDGLLSLFVLLLVLLRLLKLYFFLFI